MKGGRLPACLPVRQSVCLFVFLSPCLDQETSLKVSLCECLFLLNYDPVVAVCIRGRWGGGGVGLYLTGSDNHANLYYYGQECLDISPPLSLYQIAI